MIDVTEQYTGAVKAERDGANVLILFKLKTGRKALNNKYCKYELHHEWLSSENADLCEVRGSDYTLWTKTEGEAMISNGLFESVSII
jgi:hypothetical protein